MVRTIKFVEARVRKIRNDKVRVRKMTYVKVRVRVRVRIKLGLGLEELNLFKLGLMFKCNRLG